MFRRNLSIQVVLAVILIVFAAVVGRLERMRSEIDAANSASDSALRKMADRADTRGRSPELIVRFKPGVTPLLMREAASRLNDRIADRIESVNGLAVIDDLDDADPSAAAAEYASMSDIVDYAEPNTEISLSDPETGLGPGSDEPDVPDGGPNDPQFVEQWALNNLGLNGGKRGVDVRAIDAWRATQGSHDVVVAVLDSGVDYTHVDLKENMWVRPEGLPAYQDQELGVVNDLNGFASARLDADPMDENGHGTHCAGIIGAEGDNGEGIAGINWHVRIMPLKFMGRGGFGDTATAIEAINYAIDRKKNGVNIRVISASWGSTLRSQSLEDAIRAAGEAGILFVAAAGNDGSNNDRSPHYPSSYDLPNVISVAAIDRTGELASFSNFGGRTVHIAAPGKDILSTWLGDSYRNASGTSMATPYVAGVAALLSAHRPKMTAVELKQRIIESVERSPGLDGKVISGGRLDAARALAR